MANGYARNFLLPKRLAVVASEANKKVIEQERMAHVRREAKEKSEAQDLSKLMTGVVLTMKRKAGDQEQLFGSVTAQDISDALAAKNFTVDRRKVHLDEPIKQLGEHTINLRLHREVSIPIQVNVLREEE